MRLIDADKIFQKVKGSTASKAVKCLTEVLVATAPTVDAVVVTRCRDCKHFNHKRMECENEAISTDYEGGAQYSLNFGLDDFCSYGEPKDGANADDHD